MTDPMLTNEMERNAVIVALKADHGDLEITCILSYQIIYSQDT